MGTERASPPASRRTGRAHESESGTDDAAEGATDRTGARASQSEGSAPGGKPASPDSPEREPAGGGPEPERSPRPGREEERLGFALPELVRRAMALGFSGFFSTEEAIRKALGDTVPRDWVDFASAQSERTRRDLLERLGGEFGRVLDEVDPVEVLERLLEGRTVEVTARIRLGERDAPRRGGGEARGTATEADVSLSVEEDDGSS